MTALKEILFPSDLSAASDRAFEHARFLAEAFGARLTLYHAAHLPAAEYGAWAAGSEEEVWTRVESKARQELERRVRGLRVPVDTVVRHDVPGTPLLADLAILERVHTTHPDLVVMATCSRVGFDRFFVGSVTEQVVRHAECPVLGVREPEHGGPLPYRVLLLSTDLSPASSRAYPMAALLARRFAARVVAVHVAAATAGAGAGGPTADGDVRRHLGRDFDGLEVKVRIESRAAWSGIVEAAREERADVVALSRRGSDSLGDKILGSNTDRVLRYAPCPVLVA
jgi:nucleotide-binding universal stress UspA family protein